MLLCLQDRDLPVSHISDLFVIHDTGAHSHSMGFQYNGKLRAPELLLRSDGVTIDLIRERESIACLYDNTILPSDLQAAPSSLPAPYPYHGRPANGFATCTPADTKGTVASSSTSASAPAPARRSSILIAAEDLVLRSQRLSVVAMTLAASSIVICGIVVVKSWRK